MKLNTILSALVASAAVLSAGAVSAATFPDFQVNPNPYYAAQPFTADKLTGNYVEVITFPTATTFEASIKFQGGQFVANDGESPLNAGRTGLGVGYALYALFQGSGTIAPGATPGSSIITASPGGNLDLFIDPGVNTATETTFTNPATGGVPFGRANFADDIQVVSGGKVIFGRADLIPTLPTCSSGGGSGINCGSFGQTNTFPLTAAGMAFFFDPAPFYRLAFESGQLNNFDVGGGRQEINGSLDLVFAAVPEPASLALVGLSLLGLCFVQRRKS